MLSASKNNNKIAWYENNGSASIFVEQVISKTVYYAESVYACDLDGDSDMDVLSASHYEIAWYENLMGTTGIATSVEHPESFKLNQNYPNPFNPITNIEYQISNYKHINLSIYNLLGEKIATLINEDKSPGTHQVQWDATGLASGVYYYQLKAGEFQEVKKMVLLK